MTDVIVAPHEGLTRGVSATDVVIRALGQAQADIDLLTKVLASERAEADEMAELCQQLTAALEQSERARDVAKEDCYDAEQACNAYEDELAQKEEERVALVANANDLNDKLRAIMGGDDNYVSYDPTRMLLEIRRLIGMA